MPLSRRLGPRRTGSASGGTPLALPRATTLPATTIIATGAFLNGSVNPDGLATNYWFAWGLTPQYGNTTASTAAGSGTIPVTVGIALTGLTTGATYHFALVAQSAAGTVSGADMTFVAQAPAPPVVTPFATSAPAGEPIEQPHLAYPLVIRLTGADVVEQDTTAEIFSCVKAIVACPAGACSELPGFGVPDPTFGNVPLATQPLTAAIEQLEPRAAQHATVIADGDPSLGAWKMKLLTAASEDQGQT